MDSMSSNTTIEIDIAEDSTVLAECLELLHLTPLDNDSLSTENDSLTYCLRTLRESSAPTKPYVLPLWQQLVWDVVFGAMLTTAVFGNSVVIWIVLAHRRMRTVTNFFLLNLSVTDLMMAVFNALFNFVFMLSSDWPFGEPYCVFSNFIATLSVSSSVFTITAISVDRYIAIVRPLTPRISKRTTSGVITAIWMCGALLSLPNLLYSSTASYTFPDGTKRTLCFLRWPDGVMGVSSLDYAYNIVILLTTYVVPLSSIVVTYSWMGHVLWRSKGIGESTEMQKSAVKSKQRVARMLTVVAILFAICWLPYHIYFLYTYHYHEVIESEYVQHVYLAFYWLAMSNSMYNPIVYYWMNSRFRGYFQVALCWCRHTNALSHRRHTLRSVLRSVGSAFSSVATKKSPNGFTRREVCEENEKEVGVSAV